MKLHLPNGLRRAVMACMAAVATLTTTIGTGIITGGAVTYMLAVPQAEAKTVESDSNHKYTDSSDGFTIKENVTLGINDGNNGCGSAQKGSEYDYGDISLENNAQLSLHLWDGNITPHSRNIDPENKVKIASDINLADGSTVYSTDGSYNFTGTITVSGTVNITQQWAKGIVFNAISGDVNSTLNLKREENGGSNWSIFTFSGVSGYRGTVCLDVSNTANNNFLVIDNENALQTACINTGDDGNTNKLSLNKSNANLRALSGNGLVQVYGTGATNDGAGLTAATLSITNDGTSAYSFSGEIDSSITLALNGGKQTLGNAIVNGNITVNQGALTVDGGKLNGTVSVSANGQLTATGSITLLNAISSAGTVDISGLESLTLGSNIIDSAQNEGAITTYTIINGGTIAGAEALTSDILKATIQAAGIQTNGTDWTFANGKLVVTLTSEELTWSGGNLTWQDGAVLDNDGVFDQEDSVTFKTAGALTATLAEDITALNVNVDADTTLTIAGGENKLTVAETLTNAGTLVLASGAYDLKSKSVSNTGTIELGNVALHASEHVTMGGNVTITGNIDVTSSKDSNGYGLRIDIGQGGTWTLQNGASVNRTTSGAYYINGELAVADNATATFSTVDDIHHGYLAPTTDPAKIKLGAGSTLNLSAYILTLWNGAQINMATNSTLKLDCYRFDFNATYAAGEQGTPGSSTQSILGTLKIDKTGGGTTIIRNDTSAESMVRNINALDIAKNNTLELQQASWNTIWNIDTLSGEGDILWNSTTTHHVNSSRLVLTGDNTAFTGDITLKRADNVSNGTGANSREHQIFVVLSNDNAAAGSVINLDGGTSNNSLKDYAGLVISTDNAKIKGLNGDEISHVHSATSYATTNTLPASTRENTTLTISGTDNYSYAGTIGSESDTSSLNLSMIGTGTQTFSNTVYAGDIAVSDGEMVFTGTTTAKDVTVSKGLLSMTGTATLQNVNLSDGEMVFTGTTTAKDVTVSKGLLSMTGAATLQNVTLTGGELSLNTANIAKLSAGAGATLSLLSTAEGAITLGALDAASVLNDVKLKITVDSALTLGVDETKSITLISGGGATGFSTTNGDNITLVGLANGIEFESLTNGVLTLKGVALAQKGDLTWQNADEDNTWLNSVAKNWLNGTDEQRWVEESTARFVGDATTGKGETITITGTVTPVAISVTGTDWEWTGDGSINCAGALTVGDGTADTELTISTTGTKTFTGGVTVNEGATLVVKNVDAWTGKVSGAGTLEFSTGSTLTTSSGVLNQFIPSTDNNQTINGVVGTVRLTNNTVLSHDSGQESNWQWVPSVVKFDITEGSRLNIDVNFDYDTWDRSGDQIVRIAGAGDGTDGITGAAVSFARNKHSLGALELADDATVYVESGAIGGFTTCETGGHTLTKVGGGALNLNGPINGSIVFDIKSGILRTSVFDKKLVTIIGEGSYGVCNAGNITIDADVDLSHFSGGLDAYEGTLNLDLAKDGQVGSATVKALTFDGYDHNNTTAAINIKTGTAITAGQYYTDCITSTLNVEQGAAFTITGGENTAGKGGAAFVHESTFLLNHYQRASTINVSGSLNMLSNHHFGLVALTDASQVVLNAESGAVLNFKGITLVSRDGNTSVGATFNIKSGAQLNLGEAGIAKNGLKGGLTDLGANILTLNIEGGATIGILDGTTKWETARDLSWAEGAVTFNTQGYKVAANGIGGTREGGAAGTIELKGAVSGSIVKDGIGTLNLLGDVSGLKDVSVNAGTLNITGGISSTGRTVALAAGTTLEAALELNGGTLSLDATGTAASLGDNALSFGTEKTALTLSLLDTASSSTPITLLQGIKEGLTLAEGATLATYFTLAEDAYSIISSTGVQLLGEGENPRPDLTADRLLGSALSVEDDKLLLTLLPAELVTDQLYWETADGNGDWSGLSWSAQNADAPKPPAVDPGKMGIDFSAAEVATYEGEVIFNGDADATVQVDVTAKVKEMTVENGKYTFANDGGSLTVTDTLTIGKNAETVLNVATEVKDIELAGATSSLSTSAGLEVSGKLTATDGGTITNTGTEAVKLTGAELGSVSLLGSGGYVLKNATFSGQVTNTDSTITLSGKHTVDREALADAELIQSSVDMYTDLNDSVSADGNGYKSGSFTTQLFTVEKNVSGEDIAQSTWQLNDTNNTGLSVTVNDDGSYTFVTESESTEYYVNKNLSYDAKDFKDAKASKLVIETAHVVISLQTALHSTEKGYIHALEQGTVALKGDNVILNQSSLDAAEGATITINGSKDDTYVIDDGSISLHKNVKAFSENASWSGTVKTGAISGGLTPVNISALGNANSTVEADSISGVALTVGTVGKVNVLGDVSLTNGDSTVNDMTVEGNLSLGATEDSSMTADTLTVDGEDGIKLQNGSDVIATDLLVTNGGVDLSESGSVEAESLLNVAKGISLAKSATVKAGTMTVGEGITLGETAKVEADSLAADAISLGVGSTVTVTGDLTVGESGISFGELSDTAAVTAKSLTNTELNVTLDEEKMRVLADSKDDKTQPIATLMEVTEGSAASIDLNGYGTDTINLPGLKYGYTLTWNDTLLQLGAVANENYMKEKFEGAEPNAIAGATLMDEAFASDGIGAGGDLEKLLASVDNGSMTEEGMAAVAGASTASLGMAFAGDVERQLRAIRNRTTTMGVNQCVVNEGMPYFNAWVNAEGNFGELDQDGLASGYQLDSWGGTVGFDVDVNPNLTLGLAVTAMYGDLTVDGPDMLDGDLDTYYVTAFARYSKRAWTHTFIGTIGKMDGSYERTVNHAGGSYTAEGDTDGMAFGLMYEVGRVYALTEDGDACLQPVFNIAYRHTTVGGYTEDGGDAALDVDDQTLDTITLGAGARFQAVVGENLYNRTSVLELRALAKLDVGDRASEADVAFIGGGSRATVESAELGAFGVELGAGLSIPVGDENDGTIFFDVSAELRSGYSNVNGTVGYRINF